MAYNYNLRFHEGIQFGPYSQNLRCYPVVMMPGKERSEIDKGGKIILPSSALDHLTRLQIQFPMLFKLTNKTQNRATHCGVLEFVADEGRVYLPYWMMRNLLLKEGEILHVEYASLRVASFAKFQPQSVDFLEISNPKAVLENALRSFATLTKGDVISINYNDKDYELCVLETKPGDAVSIIECDMDVDFAPPVGYEEPKYNKPQKPANAPQTSADAAKASNAVIGGYRLDGKSTTTTKKPTAQAETPKEKEESLPRSMALSNLDDREKRTKGFPDYDYKVGTLKLNRIIIKATVEEPMDATTSKPEEKGQKLKHIGTNKK